MNNSPVECIYDAKAQLGEGPSWLPARKQLLWVDIEKSRVHLFDPVTRDNQTFEIGCHVGCAARRERHDDGDIAFRIFGMN